MSDSDAAEADALQRLEAALDRIAQSVQVPAPDVAPRVDTVAIGARLDRLIGQLHDALAEEPSLAEEPGFAEEPSLVNESSTGGV